MTAPPRGRRVRPPGDPWASAKQAQRARPMVSLTLAPETAETLAELAERTGISRGVLVDRAVELLAAALQGDDGEQRI